jgi:hypothetical protein
MLVEKRAVGRSRNRWDYNIKITLSKIVLDDAKWMDLNQDHEKWWVLVSVAFN